MNAKIKLRGLHLAAVIAAVPLAFTAVLPSAQQLRPAAPQADPDGDQAAAGIS
jgi:hypothetical protein